MVTKGLLVRLEVKPGIDEQVENFLISALPLVQTGTGYDRMVCHSFWPIGIRDL